MFTSYEDASFCSWRLWSHGHKDSLEVGQGTENSCDGSVFHCWGSVVLGASGGIAYEREEHILLYQEICVCRFKTHWWKWKVDQGQYMFISQSLENRLNSGTTFIFFFSMYRNTTVHLQRRQWAAGSAPNLLWNTFPCGRVTLENSKALLLSWQILIIINVICII